MYKMTLSTSEVALEFNLVSIVNVDFFSWGDFLFYMITVIGKIYMKKVRDVSLA